MIKRNDPDPRSSFRYGYWMLLLTTGIILSACSVNKAELYQRMDKIDAHVHIRTGDPSIMEFARSEGFRFLTINTRSSSQEYIDQQKDYAMKMEERYPDRISYLATFSMEDFESPERTDGRQAAGVRPVRRHPTDVKPRDLTSVDIDYKQMGVGGDNSWGAWTHPQYRLTERTYSYAFRISLLGPGDDPVALAKRQYSPMGR